MLNMDDYDKEDETTRGAKEHLQSSRTDYSRGTPGRRASLGGAEIVMDLAGAKPVMVDSYLTKFSSISCATPRKGRIESDTETEVQELVTGRSTARSFVTDRTTPAQTHRSELTSGRQSRKSRQGAYGLSIITWEEFLECPSGFNDLFHLERGDLISFDSDEVNVFFHDSLMMQPMLGSLSGDGKSWTIFIESLNHMKQVRLWMLERVSVIAVIIKNNKASGKCKTAPCLIAINPYQPSVRDKLELAFERSWESIVARRRYCIEIDLGSCIEEWCLSAFRMKCNVKAAKVYITNGDEYALPTINQVAWRIACFPCLSVQRAMYKLQRRTNYDDYFVNFEGSPISICTGSKLMQIYSGSSSTKRPGIKKSVSIKITSSSQTLNERILSNGSHPPMDDATYDGYVNDAFDDRGEDQEAFGITPTPRGGALNEANMVPRPGSRMGGNFSARSYISTTRTEKKSRIPKENSLPRFSEDETIVENFHITTAAIETVTTTEKIQPATEVFYTAHEDKPQKRGVTTIIHGRGERSSEIQNLVSPGRVESAFYQKKQIITTQDGTAKHLARLESAALPASGKEKVKNSKGIGKILKEILTNNDGNKVKDTTEATPVEHQARIKESKLIVVGSDQPKEDAMHQDDMILETVRDMLPSKENTFSSGFDDAMSSVSEIISPRKEQVKPKPFLVEPQRNTFFPNHRRNGRIRHAFSDVDQDEDEFTDYEPDSVMSDNIAVNSPRLVAVKKSTKSIPITNRVAVISDLDSDLEVFDMDDEEPKIHQKENVSSIPRQKVLNPNLIRGPRGQRNSRRRYLALNSLRKKTSHIVGLQPASIRR